MNSNSKEASSQAKKNQPKAPSLKSATKRTRTQAPQQSSQVVQSDKGKVVSPRPPASSATAKDVSEQQRKSSVNLKDLQAREAEDEAKTIDATVGSGSSAQAKRGNR